jgi:hypothetical protein
MLTRSSVALFSVHMVWKVLPSVQYRKSIKHALEKATSLSTGSIARTIWADGLCMMAKGTDIGSDIDGWASGIE